MPEENGISDFQASLVKKLQGDLTFARQTQDDITKGSRLYWQRVQAVHEAVLLVLEAQTLESGLTVLTEECARLLGADAVALFLTRAHAPVLAHRAAQLPTVPAFLQAVFDHKLLYDRSFIAQLFVHEHDLISHVLCLGLTVDERHGVLALAARDAGRFEDGQAQEPFIFFARCLERRMGAWLKN